MTCNIVYRNARVHDGKRFLPPGTEVGIDGKILRVSLFPGTLSGNKIVDASGLLLSPPFMDTHSHGDLRLLTRNGINLLAQGCGTVLIGQCGFSPWGECGNHPVFLEDSDIPAFKNAKEFLGALSSARPPLEICSFAGLHALMPLKGAEDRLREAMDAGCIGLSVGLNYTGQLHTSTNDIVRLAKVLRKYGNSHWAGIAWHMRDGGKGFEASVREVVEVHQRSNVPCHINHFKRHGLTDPNAVPKALSTLESYTAITVEMYPYDISWTTLEYLSSRGAARVSDTATLEDKLSMGCRICCPAGGWSDVVPVSGIPTEWRGRSAADIAKKLALPPERVCADILRHTPSATACYQHACMPSDYEHVLRWRRGFVGGDGHAYSEGEGGHHPRSFGAAAKSFRLLVDHGWLTEEEAVAKLTSEPRQAFKIDGGRILDGHAANLCLWNPSVFRDQAALDSPNALALGVSAVFFKGCLVYHASALHDHLQIPPSP
jgi:N-acyl-D-amino-acid deacylase